MGIKRDQDLIFILFPPSHPRSESIEGCYEILGRNYLFSV